MLSNYTTAACSSSLPVPDWTLGSRRDRDHLLHETNVAAREVA